MINNAPSPPQLLQSEWLGRIAIGLGIGLFEGHSGDNRQHRHLAHQISCCLDSQPMEIMVDGIRYQGSAFFIPANTPHQLLPNHYRSIYMDTTHVLAKAMQQYIDNPLVISALPDQLLTLLNQSFQPDSSLQNSLVDLLQCMTGGSHAQTTTSIAPIREQLYQGVLTADIPERRALAQIAGLSESRFSHWFSEQTGLPLRSYRKWLRLVCGLQQMQQGQALTSIAHQAQFSDQAHFTRTCVQMFGVKPSDLSRIEKIEFIGTVI